MADVVVRGPVANKPRQGGQAPTQVGQDHTTHVDSLPGPVLQLSKAERKQIAKLQYQTLQPIYDSGSWGGVSPKDLERVSEEDRRNPCTTLLDLRVSAIIAEYAPRIYHIIYVCPCGVYPKVIRDIIVEDRGCANECEVPNPKSISKWLRRVYPSLGMKKGRLRVKKYPLPPIVSPVPQPVSTLTLYRNSLASPEWLEACMAVLAIEKTREILRDPQSRSKSALAGAFVSVHGPTLLDRLSLCVNGVTVKTIHTLYDSGMEMHRYCDSLRPESVFTALCRLYPSIQRVSRRHIRVQGPLSPTDGNASVSVTGSATLTPSASVSGADCRGLSETVEVVDATEGPTAPCVSEDNTQRPVSRLSKHSRRRERERQQMGELRVRYGMGEGEDSHLIGDQVPIVLLSTGPPITGIATAGHFLRERGCHLYTLVRDTPEGVYPRALYGAIADDMGDLLTLLPKGSRGPTQKAFERELLSRCPGVIKSEGRLRVKSESPSPSLKGEREGVPAPHTLGTSARPLTKTAVARAFVSKYGPALMAMGASHPRGLTYEGLATIYQYTMREYVETQSPMHKVPGPSQVVTALCRVYPLSLRRLGPRHVSVCATVQEVVEWTEASLEAGRGILEPETTPAVTESCPPSTTEARVLQMELRRTPCTISSLLLDLHGPKMLEYITTQAGGATTSDIHSLISLYLSRITPSLPADSPIPKPRTVVREMLIRYPSLYMKGKMLRVRGMGGNKVVERDPVVRTRGKSLLWRDPLVLEAPSGSEDKKLPNGSNGSVDSLMQRIKDTGQHSYLNTILGRGSNGSEKYTPITEAMFNTLFGSVIRSGHSVDRAEERGITEAVDDLLWKSTEEYYRDHLGVFVPVSVQSPNRKGGGRRRKIVLPEITVVVSLQGTLVTCWKNSPSFARYLARRKRGKGGKGGKRAAKGPKPVTQGVKSQSVAIEPSREVKQLSECAEPSREPTADAVALASPVALGHATYEERVQGFVDTHWRSIVTDLSAHYKGVSLSHFEDLYAQEMATYMASEPPGTKVPSPRAVVEGISKVYAALKLVEPGYVTLYDVSKVVIPVCVKVDTTDAVVPLVATRPEATSDSSTEVVVGHSSQEHYSLQEIVFTRGVCLIIILCCCYIVC
ncbi:hypothetical protein KIPB_000399 [Kipferlia bialata]|uniref:Uncharacterized protein n=1 Tax=Kipferlia bialata TaxID=797122 RepID=A0A9K3CNH2_9EUKA|nr:hypothetical protein KIPB_000399 [Kipferlia bialata]|eukprot:g399.t1